MQSSTPNHQAYLETLSSVNDVCADDIEGRVLEGDDTAFPDRSVWVTR